MAVQEINDVAQYIRDNAKLASDEEGIRKYTVDQKVHDKFLNDRGITKETVKQFNAAIADYDTGSAVALKDILIENPEEDRIVISTRTRGGSTRAIITKEVHTKSPKTGDPITKYGVVSIRIKAKSRIAKEVLEECQTDIEAIVCKK